MIDGDRIRLGDVARIEAPLVDPTKEQFSMLPHVGAEHITPMTGELRGVRTAREDGMESGKYLFEASDVLYSKLRPYLRKATVAQFRGLCSADIYPIKTNGNQLLPSFLRALLVSPDFNTYANGSSARSRMPKLNREQLFDYKFLLPSIERQKAIDRTITAKLKEVKTVLEAAEMQLLDTAILRKRIFSEAFAHLDAVPLKMLGEFAATTSGSTPSREKKQYWHPAQVPWVKTGEIRFAPIVCTEESVSSVALAECSLTLLPAKTVLVAMYGQGKTRGQSAILEIEGTVNQACFAIFPNSTWRPSFLYYWFVFSYQDLRRLSENRGGNQANLNGALLNALQIPAPDTAVQDMIVHRITDALIEVDALESASKSMLKDIGQLTHNLLAQVFEK